MGIEQVEGCGVKNLNNGEWGGQNETDKEAD